MKLWVLNSSIIARFPSGLSVFQFLAKKCEEIGSANQKLRNFVIFLCFSFGLVFLLKNCNFNLFAISSKNLEKSAQTSANNQEESTGGEMMVEKDDIEQQSQEEEHQPEEAATLCMDNTAPDIVSKNENTIVTQEDDPAQDYITYEEDEPDLIVKDEVSEEDEENAAEVISRGKIDVVEEPEHSDNYEAADSDMAAAPADVENVPQDAIAENPIPAQEKILQPDQRENKNSEAEVEESELRDDADIDVDEVAEDDERNNMAMEDDVLDMLDYDIEMPDQSQVEHGNDPQADDDAKQSDGKTGEDLGNKDSSVASERLV